jgi:pyridoxal phosphate enzyme (YggS family)
MTPTSEEFRQRADAIRARIAAACAQVGRDPATVELLAVTKTHPAAAAALAAEYGLRAVGENRVQEAAEKKPLSPPGLKWELIGHLQSNKSRLAVQTFDRIQSVDSEKLLHHLDRAAAERGQVLPILLQFNAGQDPAKFGAEVSDGAKLVEAALARPHLRLEGLMTIAPLDPDPAVNNELAIRTFTALRTLRDDLAGRYRLPLATLSMGMTGDLEAAVAAGSTLVRVGTALFGHRATPA